MPLGHRPSCDSANTCNHRNASQFFNELNLLVCCHFLSFF
nr:MAG TPA: hypothetical protein [Caudoviricetes sp.]